MFSLFLVICSRESTVIQINRVTWKTEVSNLKEQELTSWLFTSLRKWYKLLPKERSMCQCKAGVHSNSEITIVGNSNKVVYLTSRISTLGCMQHWASLWFSLFPYGRNWRALWWAGEGAGGAADIFGERNPTSTLWPPFSSTKIMHGLWVEPGPTAADADYLATVPPCSWITEISAIYNEQYVV